MDWAKLLLFTGLLNVLVGQGASIYFSQKEVNITRTFLPDTGFLYVVKAIAKSDEDGQIQYSISDPIHTQERGRGKNHTQTSSKCLRLVIDANLGNISVVLPESRGNDNAIDSGVVGEAGPLSCRYKVRAALEQGSNAVTKGDRDRRQGSKDKAVEMMFILNTITGLTILSRKVDCETLSKKELCFAGTNHLELRVMENAPVTPVFYLGSLPGMCSTIKVSYNVSVEQGVVSATKARNYEPLSDILTTKADLDREQVEAYSLHVNCILESIPERTESQKIEVIKMDGRLQILDENDNVPMTGDGKFEVDIYISLSDHNFKLAPGTRLMPQDHSELLAEDLDTLDVNNFKIFNVNDTKGLLEFDFTQYAINSSKGNMTAVILKITLSPHVQEIAKAPWEGYYCVLAVMNDSSVIPSKRGQDFKYTVCVSWGDAPHSHKPSEKPSTDDLLNRLSHQVISTKLPRTAQKFAPVLYPFPDIVEDVSETVSGLKFSLVEVLAFYNEMGDFETTNANDESSPVITTTYSLATAENLRIFEVTPKMGIIYLTHPEFIRNITFHSFQLQIHCNASFIPAFHTNITITLEDDLSNETICDDELCAIHADGKSCEQACGYGSLGKCEWRREINVFKNSLGNDEDDSLEDASFNPLHYPTCSPRLATCPDGKCDEMEKSFPHLCPQDCATELRGFGHLQKHSNGRMYGINAEYCKGVGTCQDAHTCSCAPLPPPPVESPLSPTSTENLAFIVPDSQCGVACMLIYLGMAVGAVLFIVISVYAWKARKDRRKKARALNQSVMMSANGIELPFGDSTGHNTLISDAEYSSRGLNRILSDDQFAQNQVVQFEIDSKWEISRDALMLEHVLGEGQFGRVLKGRLHGHGGGGHIPVAVKMLKVEQGERSKSLWQEFMAEFSLLKQVDHPNVIKLLGACTTNGGPPYLVMEYAEYGALRSFLRKCRHVENINGSHSALHWDNPEFSSSPGVDPLHLKYEVTPREVLGFSWQIAKGMAYLSDMKMVHRDLAARNILLTKLKVCKISDFGLTRDIYVDDAYQKKSKDRVPVKWLAPECLADELYTTKSDVWAFGILVWELTTLGAGPYPGIQTEQLYALLNTGYRMPQPQNCSNELYSLMRRCWAYQPANRPTFHQIVLELSKMLEDGNEYLKLDFPSVSNPGYDYFPQSDQTGSEMVNLSPSQESPISEVRPHSRRKLSMENLRLIDYEISTNDEFLSKRPPVTASSSTSVTRHTYINDPNPSTSSSCDQDCSSKLPQVISSSASGYESPIRHATSVAV